jgi:hypothetical protein
VVNDGNKLDHVTFQTIVVLFATMSFKLVIPKAPLEETKMYDFIQTTWDYFSDYFYDKTYFG